MGSTARQQQRHRLLRINRFPWADAPECRALAAFELIVSSAAPVLPHVILLPDASLAMLPERSSLTFRCATVRD
jgi:hypothetical protein